MADHMHMLLPAPPKYSVAQVVGYIKGRRAISIARTHGYFVSTVGRDEAAERDHIPKQEAEDARLDRQLNLIEPNCHLQVAHKAASQRPPIQPPWAARTQNPSGFAGGPLAIARRFDNVATHDLLDTHLSGCSWVRQH